MSYYSGTNPIEPRVFNIGRLNVRPLDPEKDQNVGDPALYMADNYESFLPQVSDYFEPGGKRWQGFDKKVEQMPEFYGNLFSNRFVSSDPGTEQTLVRHWPGNFSSRTPRMGSEILNYHYWVVPQERRKFQRWGIDDVQEVDYYPEQIGSLMIGNDIPQLYDIMHSEQWFHTWARTPKFDTWLWRQDSAGFMFMSLDTNTSNYIDRRPYRSRELKYREFEKNFWSFRDFSTDVKLIVKGASEGFDQPGPEIDEILNAGPTLSSSPEFFGEKISAEVVTEPMLTLDWFKNDMDNFGRYPQEYFWVDRNHKPYMRDMAEDIGVGNNQFDFERMDRMPFSASEYYPRVHQALDRNDKEEILFEYGAVGGEPWAGVYGVMPEEYWNNDQWGDPSTTTLLHYGIKEQRQRLRMNSDLEQIPRWPVPISHWASTPMRLTLNDIYTHDPTDEFLWMYDSDQVKWSVVDSSFNLIWTLGNITPQANRWRPASGFVELDSTVTDRSPSLDHYLFDLDTLDQTSWAPNFEDQEKYTQETYSTNTSSERRYYNWVQYNMIRDPDRVGSWVERVPKAVVMKVFQLTQAELLKHKGDEPEIETPIFTSNPESQAMDWMREMHRNMSSDVFGSDGKGAKAFLKEKEKIFPHGDHPFWGGDEYDLIRKMNSEEESSWYDQAEDDYLEKLERASKMKQLYQEKLAEREEKKKRKFGVHYEFGGRIIQAEKPPEVPQIVDQMGSSSSNTADIYVRPGPEVDLDDIETSKDDNIQDYTPDAPNLPFSLMDEKTKESLIRGIMGEDVYQEEKEKGLFDSDSTSLEEFVPLGTHPKHPFPIVQKEEGLIRMPNHKELHQVKKDIDDIRLYTKQTQDWVMNKNEPAPELPEHLREIFYSNESSEHKSAHLLPDSQDSFQLLSPQELYVKQMDTEKETESDPVFDSEREEGEQEGVPSQNILDYAVEYMEKTGRMPVGFEDDAEPHMGAAPESEQDLEMNEKFIKEYQYFEDHPEVIHEFIQAEAPADSLYRVKKRMEKLFPGSTFYINPEPEELEAAIESAEEQSDPRSSAEQLFGERLNPIAVYDNKAEEIPHWQLDKMKKLEQENFPKHLVPFQDQDDPRYQFSPTPQPPSKEMESDESDMQIDLPQKWSFEAKIEPAHKLHLYPKFKYPGGPFGYPSQEHREYDMDISSDNHLLTSTYSKTIDADLDSSDGMREWLLDNTHNYYNSSRLYEYIDRQSTLDIRSETDTDTDPIHHGMDWGPGGDWAYQNWKSKFNYPSNANLFEESTYHVWFESDRFERAMGLSHTMAMLQFGVSPPSTNTLILEAEEVPTSGMKQSTRFMPQPTTKTYFINTEDPLHYPEAFEEFYLKQANYFTYRQFGMPTYESYRWALLSNPSRALGFPAYTDDLDNTSLTYWRYYGINPGHGSIGDMTYDNVADVPHRQVNYQYMRGPLASSLGYEAYLNAEGGFVDSVWNYPNLTVHTQFFPDSQTSTPYEKDFTSYEDFENSMLYYANDELVDLSIESFGQTTLEELRNATPGDGPAYEAASYLEWQLGNVKWFPKHSWQNFFVNVDSQDPLRGTLPFFAEEAFSDMMFQDHEKQDPLGGVFSTNNNFEWEYIQNPGRNWMLRGPPTSSYWYSNPQAQFLYQLHTNEKNIVPDTEIMDQNRVRYVAELYRDLYQFNSTDALDFAYMHAGKRIFNQKSFEEYMNQQDLEQLENEVSTILERISQVKSADWHPTFEDDEYFEFQPHPEIDSGHYDFNNFELGTTQVHWEVRPDVWDLLRRATSEILTHNQEDDDLYNFQWDHEPLLHQALPLHEWHEINHVQLLPGHNLAGYPWAADTNNFYPSSELFRGNQVLIIPDLGSKASGSFFPPSDVTFSSYTTEQDLGAAMIGEDASKVLTYTEGMLADIAVQVTDELAQEWFLKNAHFEDPEQPYTPPQHLQSSSDHLVFSEDSAYENREISDSALHPQKRDYGPWGELWGHRYHQAVDSVQKKYFGHTGLLEVTDTLKYMSLTPGPLFEFSPEVSTHETPQDNAWSHSQIHNIIFSDENELLGQTFQFETSVSPFVDSDANNGWHYNDLYPGHTEYTVLEISSGSHNHAVGMLPEELYAHNKNIMMANAWFGWFKIGGETSYDIYFERATTLIWKWLKQIKRYYWSQDEEETEDEPFKQVDPTLPTGLVNVGNSCFLNAIVQSLEASAVFKKWLGTTLAKNQLRNAKYSLPVLESLGLTFEHLRAGKTGAPPLLTNKSIYDYFIEDNEQKDAKDLLSHIMYFMEKETNYRPPANLLDLKTLLDGNDNDWEEMPTPSPDPHIFSVQDQDFLERDPFMSVIAQKITCRHCKALVSNEIVTTDIVELSIHEAQYHNYPMTLDGLFEFYRDKTSDNMGMCPRCGTLPRPIPDLAKFNFERIAAEQGLEIGVDLQSAQAFLNNAYIDQAFIKPPRLMVINFDFWKQVHEPHEGHAVPYYGWVHITQPVDYPTRFNLGPYCCSPDSQKEIWYRLVSIVHHQKDSSEKVEYPDPHVDEPRLRDVAYYENDGGHFTTYRKPSVDFFCSKEKYLKTLESKKWHLLDDDEVSELETIPDKFKEPYLLFFELETDIWSYKV